MSIEDKVAAPHTWATWREPVSQPPLDPPGYPNLDVRSHPPYAQSDGRPGYQNGGQPPYPDYSLPSEPPAKRRNVGKITIVILAGLVAAGSAVIYYSSKEGAEKPDNSKSTIQTHVVEPKTLGGRAKQVSANLRRATDQGLAKLKKLVPQATGTVVAFYGDPRDKDMVLTFGVSAPVPDPDATIDRFVGAMGTKVSHLNQVQPGPLGGVAKCGDAKLAENVPIGVCAWADSNTRGMIAMYFKSGDQAATEFVKIRGEIERRN
ncbi:hypothetical protein ACGFIJ_33125 [Microbispora bryophytorum]|uniref:hypothetical protein n=1 Tax=Microbispora bryophytorum TaxID=1460882 RepID=UPI00371E65D4